MSTSARMILVLTLITTLVGGVLSAWDGITQPKIQQHKLEALKAAIADVLPQYDHYEEVQTDGMTFYVGKDGSGNMVGIAFQAVGSGFQGEISMMVGVEPDFSNITGLTILSQVETPGLGTKIVEDPSNKQNPDWFTDQFKELKTEPEITALKNEQPEEPTEVAAITGATISSKAVVDIINSTLEQAKEAYNSESEQVVS